MRRGKLQPNEAVDQKVKTETVDGIQHDIYLAPTGKFYVLLQKPREVIESPQLSKLRRLLRAALETRGIKIDIAAVEVERDDSNGQLEFQAIRIIRRDVRGRAVFVDQWDRERTLYNSEAYIFTSAEKPEARRLSKRLFVAERNYQQFLDKHRIDADALIDEQMKQKMECANAGTGEA